MKKRLFVIFASVLVVVLALFAFTACNTEEVPVDTELVKNGDFESSTVASAGKYNVTDWLVSEDWDTKTSSYSLDGRSDDGGKFLNITNSTAGYAYLYQQIKVDRNATYKITVDIKLTESVKKGSDDDYYGAYVTFLENPSYRFKEQVKVHKDDETANWKTVTFYVNPVNTDYLTICLTLGGADAESRGTALFDNVSMVKVTEVPEGEEVTTFKKSNIARYNVDVSGILFVTFLCLFTVAVLVGAYIIIRRLYSKSNAFLNYDQYTTTPGTKGAVVAVKKVATHPAFIATILATFAGLLNLIFLLSMFGFGGEIKKLADLALVLGEKGAVQTAYISNASKLATTAPGVVYILSIIGMAGKNLEIGDVAILIRLVNVIATMATVVMIYLYGRKYVGDRQSVIYAVMYSLLPITLIMGGLDHTFTALLVALLVGAMILLVEKKYLLTYLVFALAIVLDARALAIAPLAVTYMAYRYYKDDADLKKFTANRAMIIFGLVGAFVLVYLLTLPVAINFISAEESKPFYGFTLIANQIINNKVMIDNALGLYGLATMNEKPINSTASVINLVFLLVFVIYVATLYFKNRNKQEVLLLSSFTFAVIGVLTLKVDYTYLFLALALGFIYTMISGEKRMFGILGGYSVLTFLGIGQLMSNSGFVTSELTMNNAIREGKLLSYFANFETTSPEFIAFSVLAVLLTGYYLYVSYSITNNGKRVDIPAMLQPFHKTANAWFKDLPNKLSTGKKEK